MGRARAAGLLVGVIADALFGDPRRGHPVGGFGRVAAAAERRWWRDDARVGALYAVAFIAAPTAVGFGAQRATARSPVRTAALTAVATWAVLGGASLAREGAVMQRLLAADDLPGARRRLSHLCAREAAGLDAAELARASVESVAENTGDAVVAPLLWGAVAGVPGLLGYRAVNTLDAMVGYRSARYLRFGWAAARLDDAANLVPARVTGALTVLAAPVVGGCARRARSVLAADHRAHPSPNAGWCEAPVAGALGLQLGGAGVYAGTPELRPVLGAGGRPPTASDIPRVVRLSRAVTVLAAVLAVGIALVVDRSRGAR